MRVDSERSPKSRLTLRPFEADPCLVMSAERLTHEGNPTAWQSKAKRCFDSFFEASLLKHHVGVFSEIANSGSERTVLVFESIRN